MRLFELQYDLAMRREYQKMFKKTLPETVLEIRMPERTGEFGLIPIDFWKLEKEVFLLADLKKEDPVPKPETTLKCPNAVFLKEEMRPDTKDYHVFIGCQWYIHQLITFREIPTDKVYVDSNGIQYERLFILTQIYPEVIKSGYRYRPALMSFGSSDETKVEWWQNPYLLSIFKNKFPTDTSRKGMLRKS